MLTNGREPLMRAKTGCRSHGATVAAPELRRARESRALRPDGYTVAFGATPRSLCECSQQGVSAFNACVTPWLETIKQALDFVASEFFEACDVGRDLLRLGEQSCAVYSVPLIIEQLWARTGDSE